MNFLMLKSLPVRGAWIEIVGVYCARTMRKGSLPVRGAWIEIVGLSAPSGVWRRSPCGERGLKFSMSNAISASA